MIRVLKLLKWSIGSVAILCIGIHMVRNGATDEETSAGMCAAVAGVMMLAIAVFAVIQNIRRGG
jgi:hypothetical protein